MHNTTRSRSNNSNNNNNNNNHNYNNICKHFLKGNCNYGLLCRFSHIMEQQQEENNHQYHHQNNNTINFWEEENRVYNNHNYDNEQNQVQQVHYQNQNEFSINQSQQQHRAQQHQQMQSSSSSSSGVMDEDGAAGVSLHVNWMGSGESGSDGSGVNGPSNGDDNVQIVSSDYDYYLPVSIYQHPQCNHHNKVNGCNNCSSILLNDNNNININNKYLAYERSKDKTCGVCFEVIVEKPVKQRFGILPNCNHVFCLECIRKWRQAKQFDNKIKRSCPECRTTSDFICPSRYWVDSKEDKDKLISDYKTALGARHCKYFKQGYGKCPFGNKCFYKHALTNGTLVDVGLPQCYVVRKKCIGEILQHALLWDFLTDADMIPLFSDSDDSQTDDLFEDIL